MIWEHTTELWSSLKTHFPQMVKIDSLCCCLNIYVNIRTKNLVKNTFYSDESWNFRPKVWKKIFFLLSNFARFPLYWHVPVTSGIRHLDSDMHLFSADKEITIRYLCEAVLSLKFSKNRTHFIYEVKVSVFKLFIL